MENVALHHLLINGSSAVNGCRQNESPYTADKNITINHITPVHQLKSCEWKAFTQKVKSVLILNHCFWPKKNYNPNECFLQWKVHLLLSSHIKIHPYICLELFWTFFTWTVFDQCCIFLSWFRQDNFFFTAESNIIHRGLLF